MTDHKHPHELTRQLRQNLFNVLISTPDLILLLLIAILGVVASAWIMIGAGVAVGLLVVLLAAGALLRRKNQR